MKIFKLIIALYICVGMAMAKESGVCKLRVDSDFTAIKGLIPGVCYYMFWWKYDPAATQNQVITRLGFSDKRSIKSRQVTIANRNLDILETANGYDPLGKKAFSIIKIANSEDDGIVDLTLPNREIPNESVKYEPKVFSKIKCKITYMDEYNNVLKVTGDENELMPDEKQCNSWYLYEPK